MDGMRAKKSASDSPAATVAPPKLERELARVEARRNQLWAELEEHAETVTERTARGAPVKRLLAQHDRMRDRYCVLENRRQELLAVLPARPVGPADF